MHPPGAATDAATLLNVFGTTGKFKWVRGISKFQQQRSNDRIFMSTMLYSFTKSSVCTMLLPHPRLVDIRRFMIYDKFTCVRIRQHLSNG